MTAFLAWRARHVESRPRTTAHEALSDAALAGTIARGAEVWAEVLRFEDAVIATSDAAEARRMAVALFRAHLMELARLAPFIAAVRDAAYLVAALREELDRVRLGIGTTARLMCTREPWRARPLRHPTAATLDAARAWLREGHTRKSEIRSDLKDGAALRLQRYRDDFTQVIGETVSELRGFAGRWANTLAGQNDVLVVEKTVRSEVDRLVAALDKRLAALEKK